MAKKTFRLPEEISPTKEKKIPLSTRVKPETLDELDRMSKKANSGKGMSLSSFVEHILEDYVSFAKKHKK